MAEIRERQTYDHCREEMALAASMALDGVRHRCPVLGTDPAMHTAGLETIDELFAVTAVVHRWLGFEPWPISALVLKER